MVFIIHDYKTEAFLLLVLKNYVAIIQNILLTFIYPKDPVHHFSSAGSDSSLPHPALTPLLLAMLIHIAETERTVR